MSPELRQFVLNSYLFNEAECKIKSFGTGLINNTWQLSSSTEEYILQRINHSVFKNPEDIENNINVVSNFLKLNCSEYKFVSPLLAANGRAMIHSSDFGYFRIFPFVPNSHSKDVVETAEQAFEAAAQFGKFTKALSVLDVKDLKLTIPNFHNLELRYTEFTKALQNGNPSRIKKSEELIKMSEDNLEIVKTYQEIISGNNFKLRVTHHDTKISNVLFNEKDKGICVIDLDTIMPGYFISDLGDMMRTYLCPVSENESDFSKIFVRPQFYDAIVEGYYSEMKDELTEHEKKYFLYSAKFMIYMQAIRFLADYLNNDIYYGAKYEDHNFVRAGNQFTLLQRVCETISI